MMQQEGNISEKADLISYIPNNFFPQSNNSITITFVSKHSSVPRIDELNKIPNTGKFTVLHMYFRVSIYNAFA